jgi:VWFA-related protein
MKLLRLLLVGVLLSAQTVPDSTIRVNVNLIQIDVTVTDRSGKHVPGLTVDDFEVFRDGKRQVLKSALWVEGQRPKEKPSEEGPTVARASRGIRPTEVRRTIALLIDDLSLGFESSNYARMALREFVEKQVQPGDLVALFRSSAGLGVLQQFTNNKQQLLAQIDGTRFRSINAVDSLAPIRNNQLEDDSNPSIAQMAMEERLREEVMNQQRQDFTTASMLNAAQYVIRGLKELPGRKSLILFSDTVQMGDAPKGMTNPGITNAASMIPGAMGGTRYMTINAARNLTDSANRHGVVLYTIDPRGLVYTGSTAVDMPSGNARRMLGQMQQRQLDFNQSQDGLVMLAEETGGLSFRNRNDIATALGEALADQEGYYLLSFQPDDATFEQAKGADVYRKLQVKLKPGGLKVRYHRGFYGVPDSQEGPTVSPIVSSLLSPFRATDIPVRMTPIFLSGEKGQPILRTMVHVDVSELAFQDVPADATDKNQESWKKATLNQLVVLFDQNGQQLKQVGKSHTVSLRGAGFAKVMQSGLSQELEMELPRAGAFQLRTAVLDTNSKMAGSATEYVEIPDLKNNKLAMSDLILTRENWDAEDDAAGGPARRLMKPGSTLSYASMLYNARLSKASGQPNLVTQVILYRNGKSIYVGKKAPFQPQGHKEGEGLAITGNLKLGAGSALGEYVLQIAVQDLEAPKKQQYVVRNIDFELR